MFIPSSAATNAIVVDLAVPGDPARHNGAICLLISCPWIFLVRI